MWILVVGVGVVGGYFGGWLVVVGCDVMFLVCDGCVVVFVCDGLLICSLCGDLMFVNV